MPSKHKWEDPCPVLFLPLPPPTEQPFTSGTAPAAMGQVPTSALFSRPCPIPELLRRPRAGQVGGWALPDKERPIEGLSACPLPPPSRGWWVPGASEAPGAENPEIQPPNRWPLAVHNRCFTDSQRPCKRGMVVTIYQQKRLRLREVRGLS